MAAKVRSQGHRSPHRDPDANDGLFVGIRRPSGTRMLLFRDCRATSLSGWPADPESRILGTSVNRFSDVASTFYLCIEANSPAYNEVFRYLANDVAEHVLTRSVSSRAVPTFLGRLARWKRFFEAGGEDGLAEYRSTRPSCRVTVPSGRCCP